MTSWLLCGPHQTTATGEACFAQMDGAEPQLHALLCRLCSTSYGVTSLCYEVCCRLCAVRLQCAYVVLASST